MYTVVIQTMTYHLIQRCINSIRSNYNPEIIIIEQTEEENTKIKELAESIGAVYLKRKHSESVPVGVNLVARTAKHDVVISMHDDVHLDDPYALDKLYDEYKRCNYLFMSPRIVEKKQNDMPENLIGETIPISKYEKYEGRLFVCWIFNRHIYNELGGLDEQFYPIYVDDADFFYRLKLKGRYSIGIATNIVVNHIGQGTILDRSTFYEHLRESLAKYIKKWGGEPKHEKFETPYNV